MISAAGLTAAALAGLVGSAHCVGMCGGIVATLRHAGASQRRIQMHANPRAADHAARLDWAVDQAGRVASYTLAGAAAGTVGTLAVFADSWIPAQAILFGLFNLALLLLGLQMLGWLPHWRPLEAIGARLWQRMQPAVSRVWPPRTRLQHLFCGLAWGLVPCSLVYSVLPLALLSGRPFDGALLMFVFGLGTLPGVSLIGWGAQGLMRAGAKAGSDGGVGGVAVAPLLLKRVAGALVIGWGGFGLYHASMAAQHPSSLMAAFSAWCGSLY